MADGKYEELPARVHLDDTVQEVPVYEAVGEVQGVRRVSPLSPVAGIDEARLFASIGTDSRAQPWRRRMARLTAIYLLCSTLVGLALSAVWDVFDW